MVRNACAMMLTLAALFAQPCFAGAEEKPMISLDRPAPDPVDPVVVGGIRYEQALDARELGYEGHSGYLRAVEISSGKTLWIKRVYTPQAIPGLEEDVQESFFVDLKVAPDGKQLRVKNEDNEVWIVDPETGEATAE